jgi:3-keto-5-aminohexanoate cleavage enzyme
MTPLVVMVAPNGARRTKADHAKLPITPAEIAAEAARCAEAGASILHLHVRADDGGHTLDPTAIAPRSTRCAGSSANAW